MFKITNKLTNEVQFQHSLDGFPPEEWDAVEHEEPTERDSAIAGLDDAGVETWALDKLEKDADDMALHEMRGLRRQVATAMLWNEVQRLKQSVDTGTFNTLSALEKAKRFPTLSALVQLSGNGISAVATAVENRLWNRVRRMALAEAKMLLARDAVRAAATRESKLAAADAVLWTE